MSNPNISVIIPFYNSETSLEHCLSAVYKSNYKNFEVIAVSDNSLDRSDEIAKKFPCKIVKLKKNYGSGYSRNIGSRLAKGNILVFLYSDVIIKKNSLTIIQNYFKVYKRDGKKCLKINCSGKISRVIISNRSTFYCNICQK